MRFVGRLLWHMSLGAQLILLIIEEWDTRTSNYRIWLYILRNFVWLSYINIEVSIVKPLTVVYVNLHTEREEWWAGYFMWSYGSVGLSAVISRTAEAPYCRSWGKFWFVSQNNNYYIKHFVNVTLLIVTTCCSFMLIDFFTVFHGFSLFKNRVSSMIKVCLSAMNWRRCGNLRPWHISE